MLEPKVKVNYLNNRDMLKEIHRSKSTWCSFTKPEYNQQDIIIRSFEEITPELIETAKKNKAKRLSDDEYHRLKLEGTKVKHAECAVDPNSFTDQDVVIRIMTHDHIPKENRKKNPKTVSDFHERVNFPPFQHWKYNEQGELVCVGKSHWKGDLETGNYSKTHGKMTNNLGKMIIKLAERYSTRGNVRGYTYNDEMRDQAILQLTQVILQFDESKSDNPFSYSTTICSNAFLRIINIEKQNQDLRDDILEMNGMTPSFTRLNNAAYQADFKRFTDDYNGNNNSIEE